VTARSLGLVAVLAGVLLVHWSRRLDTEPFFNNDETRHVMTGVFFRDLIHDHPTTQLKKYAVDYYLQRPALGLLVWPPGFHALLGAWMTLFGATLAAAKSLVLVFLLIALLYTHALASRWLTPLGALTVTALVGFSPVVFEHSEFVMLEIPAFACAMGAIFHLERFLAGPARSSPPSHPSSLIPHPFPRDAWLCGFWCAAAGWMRYDAVFLAPYVVLRLTLGGDWKKAANRHAVGAALLAALAVGPLYAVTFKQYAGATAAATSGTMAESKERSLWTNALFYFKTVPEQMGWPVTVFGAAALLLSLRRPRQWAAPLALVGAAWIAFSPLAELQARHAIYWIPAWCLAAVSIFERRRTATIAFLLLVGWQAWSAWQSPNMYVRGYRIAADFMAAKPPKTPVVLFEGMLNGGFIHALALRDPERRWTTIRADKLLYGVLSEASGGYEEWAKDDAAMLAAIHRFDPEFVVVEDPRVLEQIPAADRLRKLLSARPDRFRLEAEIPIDSNQHAFLGRRLLVYRPLVRNPAPEKLTELRMLSLGGTLKAE
jgi:hypothetical protein